MKVIEAHDEVHYVRQNGTDIRIDSGFVAKTFKHDQFRGAMSPLLLVDHYTMTESTFGPHPHAGLSAVSLLFEDSIGKFHNRDSLGNDFDLLPGDLYWLNAGKGIVHDESPRSGATIHGLQIFVNMPDSARKAEGFSQLIRTKDIPVITEQGARIRVVLGDHEGIEGPKIKNQPITLLDAFLSHEVEHSFSTTTLHHTWIYLASGEIELRIAGVSLELHSGQSIAVLPIDENIQIINRKSKNAHFVFISAPPIDEAFVQRGPFAMKTQSDIDLVTTKARNNELGIIPVLQA
jgi:redox-sensitive bicupin YhaK (pirin superfamily)